MNTCGRISVENLTRAGGVRIEKSHKNVYPESYCMDVYSTFTGKLHVFFQNNHTYHRLRFSIAMCESSRHGLLFILDYSSRLDSNISYTQI